MADHVLVPVDGSAQSEAAFEYVLEELPNARVTLVHVLNPVEIAAYAGDDEYFDLQGYENAQQYRREEAESMLEEYREAAEEQGMDVDTALVVGSPASRILEVAEERGVDHVVMGSHGRSGVGRVIFGSVAETVTRRSPVPVTIVR